jgi:hypothetical protein
MPTPKQAFGAFLASQDTITAILGPAIYPDQAGETVVEPYLEFQEVSRYQRKGLRGPVGSIRSRFQLKAYLATRLQAEQLQSALKTLLDGTLGTFGGLTVIGSFIGTGDEDEGATDDDEPPRPGESSGLRDVRMDVTWIIAP